MENIFPFVQLYFEQDSNSEKENLTQLSNINIFKVLNKHIFIGSSKENTLLFFELDLSKGELKLMKSLNDEEKGNMNIFQPKLFTCNNRLYSIHSLSKVSFDNQFIIDFSMSKLFKILSDTTPTCFRISYCSGIKCNKIFIFGGLNEEAQVLNSLEVFDCTTYRFK